MKLISAIEEDRYQRVPEEAGNCFPLRVPGIYQSKDRVVSFLDDILKELDISEAVKSEVKIAVMEAVFNAISHGSGQDPTREVQVQVYIDPGKLTVWVQDEGLGFDPDRVGDPLLQRNLLKPSGRGIFLMQSCMDEVTFYPTKVGTLVKMTRFLPEQPLAECGTNRVPL